mgnify:CR=1 FL=1
MVDYDKDFIFYNDSDDELVDVSNGIKTAEESANSKKGAKHSTFGRSPLCRCVFLRR